MAAEVSLGMRRGAQPLTLEAMLLVMAVSFVLLLLLIVSALWRLRRSDRTEDDPEDGPGPG